MMEAISATVCATEDERKSWNRWRCSMMLLNDAKAKMFKCYGARQTHIIWRERLTHKSVIDSLSLVCFPLSVSSIHLATHSATHSPQWHCLNNGSRRHDCRVKVINGPQRQIITIISITAHGHQYRTTKDCLYKPTNIVHCSIGLYGIPLQW